MNATKMLVGLLPWAVFSVLTQREGAAAVGIAAIAAVLLAACFLITDRSAGLKIIPTTGIACFLDRAAINAGSDARPADLLLNWLVPIGLLLLGVKGTRALAGSAGAGKDVTNVAGR